MNTQTASTESAIPQSVLARSQKHSFGPRPIKGYGKSAGITVKIRYDDQCGNGHNTFAITADVRGQYNRELSGGCMHQDIAAIFPEYAPFIKWHLCSSDGPLHYIANTTYHVEQNRLDYARSTAIWPEATDEELTSPDLKETLLARLPALMDEFKAAIESLGLVY